MNDMVTRRDIIAIIGGRCNNEHISAALAALPMIPFRNGHYYHLRPALEALREWYREKARLTAKSKRFAALVPVYTDLADRCETLLEESK